MAESRLQRTSSPEGTEAVGASLGAELRSGDVVIVSGELGAGKTTMIRGACRALGVTERVTSPTFTLAHSYQGRVPVAHLDLYRLAGAAAEEPGLLDDYLAPEGVTLIEWPEAAVLDGAEVTHRIELRHAGDDNREIVFERFGTAQDPGSG